MMASWHLPGSPHIAPARFGSMSKALKKINNICQYESIPNDTDCT